MSEYTESLRTSMRDAANLLERGAIEIARLEADLENWKHIAEMRNERLAIAAEQLRRRAEKQEGEKPQNGPQISEEQEQHRPLGP